MPPPCRQPSTFPMPLIALTTCPNDECAKTIAAALVTERLAACVNRVMGVRSTYIWDGRLQDDAEVLLIIKTTAAQLSGIEAKLKELHPYELPELVLLRIEGGSQAYLDWLCAAVAQPAPSN
jgi:periplasmic divalent cation tolerance protein